MVRRKFLLWSAAALAALLAIALALPFLIDVGDYRDEIAAAGGDRLGRELRIDGPLSLSLLPRIALRAEEVTLANAQGSGFSDRPMLRLRALDAELALTPLLSGRIEVARFVLHGPDILLERTGDGRSNWDFAGVATAGDEASSDASAKAAEFAAERIAIESGRLLYRDGGSETELEAIEAELRLASLQGPADGWLKASVAGRTYDAEFDLGRLDAATTPLRVDGSFGGHRIAFDGSLKALADSPELAGELLAMGNRAQIDFRVTSGEVTRLYGKIDIARLDLAALQGGGTSADQSGSPAAFEPIPLSLPDRVEGELSLNVAEIAGAPVAAGPTSLRARLSGGRLEIESLEAAFAGEGRLEAHGAVTAPEEYAEIALETALHVGDLGALVDLPEGWPEQAELRGQLTLAGNRLGLSGIDARLGESRITGRAGWVVAARPQLAAELAIDRLDLDRYLAPSADAGAVTRSASKERSAAFPAAGKIDGGISLTVERLTYRRRDLGPATVEAQLQRGALRLERLALGREGELRLSVSGSVRDLATAPAYELDIETAGAGLDRALSLAGAEAGAALADAGAFDLGGRVTGTFEQARFDLDGRLGGLTLRTAGQAVLAGVDAPQIEMQLEGRQASLAALAEQFGADGWPSSSDGAKPVTLTASLSHRGKRSAGQGEVKIGEGRVDFRAAREAETTTLDLNLAAPDLHRFVNDLGVAFAPQREQPGKLDLALSGKLQSERLTLDRMAGTVGPTELSGSGEADLGKTVPVVTLTLEADTVPLDAFLPASSEDAPEDADTPAQPPQWSVEAIDIAALEAVDGRLDLKAKRLSASDFVFEDLILAAESRGRRLTVEKLSGRLFGGQATIAASLDAAGELPRVATEIKLDGVDLDRLLTAAIGNSPATGTAFFEGRYRGAGISERAIVASLSGSGHLGADSGVIRGVDLVALNRGMGSLTTVADFARVTATTLGGGETAYRHLGFDLVSRDGELRSENVMADVDGADIDFDSRIDLPLWTTATEARITLAGHAHAPPVGARIAGSLADPDIAFETDRLKQWAVGRFGLALSRALTSGEGVGVADFLFGGRPPAPPESGAAADETATEPAETEATQQAQPSVGQSLLRGMFDSMTRRRSPEQQEDSDDGGGG